MKFGDEAKDNGHWTESTWRGGLEGFRVAVWSVRVWVLVLHR